MSADCRQLDEYLDGGLSDGRRANFESHLHGCQTCREAIDVAERLDALLAAARPTTAPAGLLERIDGAIQRTARVRLVWRCGALAAAAMLLLAIGFWAAGDGEHELVRTAPRPIAPVAPNAIAEPPVAPVRITFPDDVIAMPLKSANPRVTIVWVYPTLPLHEPADAFGVGPAESH